jgi:hypothetical protein
MRRKVMPNPLTKSDYGFQLAPGQPNVAHGGLGGIAQGLRAEIVNFCREFVQTAFTSYHPERHYMRGPGPACASKRNRREA